LDTKTFPLAELKIDGAGAGRFGGWVAVFGNVDHGGDLIEPGATVASLPNLVRAGFLAFGHDYRTPPIGMIDEAREDAVGLYIAGPFHSTAAAQEARTVAAERLAAGKPMGMSIGYEAKEWTYRTTPGADGTGGDQVRVLTRIDVLEGSLVPLPMNPRASLAEVKAGGDPVAAVRALVQAEAKVGRPISAARRERIAAWRDALHALRQELDDLLTETDPAAVEDGKRLLLEYERTRARLNGVAV
jgi:hypothetical protein